MTHILRLLRFSGQILGKALAHIRLIMVSALDLLLENRIQQKAHELEEQIRQLKATLESDPKKNCIADTMLVCSRFAGGVAHDLNNILSGLLTLPEMMLMDLPGDSPLVKPLQTIMKSGTRASQVVSELVAMSKGISGDKMVLDLNTAITRFLASEAFSGFQAAHPGLFVQPDLLPDLLNIRSSSDHIDTLLKHLINQGSDAMAGEGRILIKTENTYFDTPPTSRPGLTAGEYICLSVSDSGQFIPKDHVDHMFEPYYCKKVMARSCSGLGMAIAWNMMASSGGFITIRSSQEGSVYDLFFPASREKVGDREDSGQATAKIQGDGETVLIVDDDELQRDIASDILARAGYTVHTVPSGEQAVEHLKNKKADLLVLDMVMPPGMDGYETYQTIIQFAPGQKAVIASGFVRSSEVEKIQSLGAGGYIRKPYLVNDLLLAVRKELDRRE